MAEPILIFHAGTQVWKFRFLLYFSLTCFAVSLAGFYWIGFTPQPGLIVQERWLLALVVLAVGFGFFGGMLVYSNRYVVWLWLDEHADEVSIETNRLFGEREVHFPVSDLLALKHEAGDFVTRYHRLHTPFLKLRVKGQRLPYVIDLQGHLSDPEALLKITGRNPKRGS